MKIFLKLLLTCTWGSLNISIKYFFKWKSKVPKNVYIVFVFWRNTYIHIINFLLYERKWIIWGYWELNVRVHISQCWMKTRKKEERKQRVKISTMKDFHKLNSRCEYVRNHLTLYLILPRFREIIQIYPVGTVMRSGFINTFLQSFHYILMTFYTLLTI